jgi:hypothetical protein
LPSSELKPDDIDDHEDSRYGCRYRGLFTEKSQRQASSKSIVLDGAKEKEAG